MQKTALGKPIIRWKDGVEKDVSTILEKRNIQTERRQQKIVEDDHLPFGEMVSIVGGKSEYDQPSFEMYFNERNKLGNSEKFRLTR